MEREREGKREKERERMGEERGTLAPVGGGGREQEEAKGAGLCMCHTRPHLYHCDSNYFLSQVSCFTYAIFKSHKDH